SLACEPERTEPISFPVAARRLHFTLSAIYFFFVQTASRSSEHGSRIPLSERISSVALSALWWSKTIVSEYLSSKTIVVYFSFESRSTSTKWRRFLIRVPLTSLTTFENGLS